MYFRLLALLMIASFLCISSCEMKSENELYQEIMSIDDSQQRIKDLDEFISKYPENKNMDKILRRMFLDYVNLKDAPNAVLYADKYLNYFPKGYRMNELNGVAWSLAENNIGLDSAKVYADRAVAQASKSNTRTLNNIKDTQAFVYFQAGEAKQALTIQMEAIEGNENNFDFLNRLGLYQHGAGEIENAYKTISKSLLLGGGLESGNQLKKWLQEDYKSESDQQKISKSTAKFVVKEYLIDGITNNKKSQVALLLAILNVDLDKAEKWASEAIQSLNENSESNQYLMYNINLASVYEAKGEQTKALTLLQNVKDYASIFDFGYWLHLGNAYLNNNQKDEAINSYLGGMLWRETPEFVNALTNLGLNDTDIKTKIEKRKQELLNFHPGKYNAENNQSNRIVLTELFTGAECPPCKGADLAMDLIAEYYPRSMVTILEYHLHIPGPDPLTNPDSEARYKFYGKNFGTPTTFFNGQNKMVGGGPELIKRDTFNKYKKSIEKYFTSESSFNIDLNANLNDNKIEVNSKINIDSKFKNKVNLNIAIVEKSVDYVGGNGITKHAFVVRYLMTGGEGEKIDLNKTPFNYSDSIDLTTIENRQSQYLADFVENPPKRHKNFAGWNDTKDQLNQEQLAIVAWVHDVDSKEILQSGYIDL